MNKRFRMSFITAMLFFGASVNAQDAMRVHYKDGTMQDIPVAQIDSVTFVDKEETQEEISLTGNWLWGNQEAGYYELITFSEDHSFTGYDNYFTYGFDTMTYGWYYQYGTMLTLRSNGFGYQRMYNWYIIGLTNNALEVMTKMGAFIYHKLQPDVLYISSSESYSGFEEGDSVVFADGVVVTVGKGKLIGLASGTTYVLIEKASVGQILAYKVVVK